MPREFIGLARQLRRDVLQADQQLATALEKLIKPLRRRLVRKPTLREGQMIDAARRWREMRVPFRLGVDGDTLSKGSMSLTEWRLSSSRWTDPRWSEGGDEAGVGVVRVRLTVERGNLNIAPTPMINLSLHALARWYQRSGQRDREALLRDCVPLVTGQDADRVRAGAGYWYGRVVIADGEANHCYRLRDVRTYFSGG